MTKRIVALVFTAAIAVGLASAPAQADTSAAKSSGISVQSGKGGWEWGSF